MKTLIRRYPYLSKRMIMPVAFIVLVISCSKNSNDPSKTALKICESIDWTSTLGFSGYFKGALEKSTFGLTSVNFKDNSKNTTLVFNRDGSGHIISDNLGNTYTYDKDNLVKIETGNATGKITFTFDTSSHLTQTHVQNSDNTGTSELILNYTYDSNGDPVKIIGHGVTISNGETSVGDYDITADYLTDKTNFLSLIPEIAPFTPYFAYSWYLSQHLINKWQIKITITAGGKVVTSNVTQQYTYTYDSDGRVATMFHSANNKFTFTYSGCN